MKNPEFPTQEKEKEFTTFQIENYKGHSVFVTNNEGYYVSKPEVARNIGPIVIHLDAYKMIQKSPKFEHYLNVILEHEATHGVGHTHENLPHTQDEQEILDFLKKEGYFE